MYDASTLLRPTTGICTHFFADPVQQNLGDLLRIMASSVEIDTGSRDISTHRR
jgi:hypothetical protein